MMGAASKALKAAHNNMDIDNVKYFFTNSECLIDCFFFIEILLFYSHNLNKLYRCMI